MLFLGIISWKGALNFNGGVVFQMGGFIFKWRVRPIGRDISFDGGGWGGSIKKEDGGGAPMPLVRSSRNALPHPLQSRDLQMLFVKENLDGKNEILNT